MVFWAINEAKKSKDGGIAVVLITKCPICNLFAKKVLMLYNKDGFETEFIGR